MSGRRVAAFAPTSVANVACGFDVLGFAIEPLGDTVSAELDGDRGIVIERITGDGGRLPKEADRNTASVAARAVLERSGRSGVGLRLRIDKRAPLASGLGSSAASAVAAAVAVDALLGTELPTAELLRCAMAGERIASGSDHADNLAPSLLGGMVLVRSLEPAPDIVPLPVPDGLSCAIVRPHIAVHTREARARLGESIALADAVTQWGNVGALVAALYRGDLDLLSRALHDAIAEPVRAPAVAGFAIAKRTALERGALGCSLSGSGPAIFALCRDLEQAAAVSVAMAAAIESDTGIDCDRLASVVGAPGARMVPCDS